MIKVYHGSNIDAINWKIHSDFINKSIRFFSSNTSSATVADQLCQCNLFETSPSSDVYVVNIDNWKLINDNVVQNIKELHAIDKLVIFTLESATVKNKIFTTLKIDKIKATSITKKSKTAMISKLLSKSKIKLDSLAEETLVNILPDNIDFIKNEISKLQLIGQNSFTSKEIKQIIFDLGDATIFNIADSWLNGNHGETIERLNDLIAKNITIQAFVPIFALKLMQIKLFLMAKQSNWSPDVITTAMGIPFWLQSNYGNLRPYDKNLRRINTVLDKLYQLDINIKKQKNIPYTQIIKILFQ